MTIADSNVLLDVLSGGSEWLQWSTGALDTALSDTGLVINAIIYAEIAPRFRDAADVDAFLSASGVKLEPLTREMLHAAGWAHRRYRRSGGDRERILPDFLIGAHAQVSGRAILTRDPKGYRRYFPTVTLITP